METIYVGENKILEVTLRDKDNELFDIASLDVLQVEVRQGRRVLASYDLFYEEDEELSYEGAVLKIEITKSVSETFVRGIVTIRIKMSNPNDNFTDGQQHVDILEFDAFEVLL